MNVGPHTSDGSKHGCVQNFVPRFFSDPNFQEFLGDSVQHLSNLSFTRQQYNYGSFATDFYMHTRKGGSTITRLPTNLGLSKNLKRTLLA